MRVLNNGSWRVWMRMSDECVHHVIILLLLLYWYLCVVCFWLEREDLNGIGEGKKEHTCACATLLGHVGPLHHVWVQSEEKQKRSLSYTFQLLNPNCMWIIFSYTYLHINRSMCV